MFQTSVLHIHKQALINNLEFIKGLVGKKTRISSVIKGNAYGHGIEVFVPLAEYCGINHFSVFNADEALRAYKASEQNSGIMIMGMIDTHELDWAIRNDIEFFVFEFDRLFEAIETARRLNKPARIHLEMETGMNRTGFDERDAGKVIQVLQNNKKHYILEGICTHFAGAESIANYARIMNQQN